MGDVSVDIEVAATSDRLYELVADLPRMGEWSPECTRVEWTGGASGPFPGAHFIGHNRNGWRRWSTHGEVTVADPGREFAFEVRSILNLPVARWSYVFAPVAGGEACRVVETTVDRRGWLVRALGRLATGISNRPHRNRQTMRRTLEALRRAAEDDGARG